MQSINFLYGGAKAPPDSPTSLKNCLWGKASDEFASSLRGNVLVIGANASPDRVFGKVEIPAVLENAQITALCGEHTGALRALLQKEGTCTMLDATQNALLVNQFFMRAFR